MSSLATRFISIWIVLALIGNLSIGWSAAHAIHSKNIELEDQDVALVCAGTHLQPVVLSDLQNKGEINFAELPEDSELGEHDLECKLTLSAELLKSPLSTPYFSLYAHIDHEDIDDDAQQIEIIDVFWNTANPRAPPFVS